MARAHIKTVDRLSRGWGSTEGSEPISRSVGKLEARDGATCKIRCSVESTVCLGLPLVDNLWRANLSDVIRHIHPMADLRRTYEFIKTIITFLLGAIRVVY
jgi:hypothetical protein